MSHTHNVYLQGGSASLTGGAITIDFTLHSRHTDSTSGAYGCSSYLTNSTHSTGNGDFNTPSRKITTNTGGSWDNHAWRYYNSMSTSLSHSNPTIWSASSGGTQNSTAGASTTTTTNGTNCGDEVRVDNLTIKICTIIYCKCFSFFIFFIS